MIKILMLIPVWKRPEILRLFLWRMEAVIPDYAEIRPVFILSPEDPHLKTLEMFLSDYQCFYYSNEYLSDKLNAGMLYIMQYDWDYLMGMGSDDVYTPLLWELYREYFETGEKYFAINEMYFYDVVNERAWFNEKYVDEKELGGFGCGRMIHRSLLEDDPKIYRPRTCCGMDGFSAMTLYRRGGHIQKIVEPGGLPVMLDIKTNTNVNHSVEMWPHRTREVDVTWIKEQFGLVDAQILDDGTFSLLNFDGFHSQVVKLSQEIRKEDAFNTVNTTYEMAFGTKRFRNVESYKVQVSKRYKQ